MSEEKGGGTSTSSPDGGSTVLSGGPVVVDTFQNSPCEIGTTKKPSKAAAALSSSPTSSSKPTALAYTAKMDWVIFPNNRFIKIWDLIVLVCLYILLFMLPYQIGVSGGYSILVSIPWFVFNVLINAVFFVDTFLYFFRAYRTKDGQLVFNLRKIQRRYLKGMFIPNLLSVLPFTIWFYVAGTRYMESLSDQEDATGQSQDFQNNLVLIVGLLKLIRLVRVKSIMSSSDLIINFRLRSNSQVLSLFKYIIVLVVIVHWFACVWCFVAFLEAGDFAQLLATPNWINNWYQSSYVEGGPNPIGYTQSIDRYVISLFWAIQTITSIGYGNISPVTVAEWWVGCALQLLAGILWAYFIGGLVGVAAGMNAREDAFNSRSDDANFLISYFNEPTVATCERAKPSDRMSAIGDLNQSDNLTTEAVAKRIRLFIHHQYRTSAGTSASLNSIDDLFPIIQTLPPELQMLASLLVMQKELETVPYLSSRYLTIEEQCDVALACKLLEFSSGEIVRLNEFECGRGIFVLRHGCAFVVRNNHEKPLLDRLELLTAGSAFDPGKVLIERENPASRGVLQFLTFGTVIFVPESAVSAVFEKNKRAWSECGRWMYLKTLLRDQEKKVAEEAV